jgi:hypothetical protein
LIPVCFSLSFDFVVGLFIRFSLLHLHLFVLFCVEIFKVGLFFRFSLLLVVSIICFACLISWLGCSRFSLPHFASLLS